MTLPAACLTGDSHGQSKEARSGAQEELETRQRKRQACAQVGGKARDAEKSEVQGPARRHEREETRGREKAAAGHSGKKTSGPDASRNHGHRRHRETGPRRRRRNRARRSHRSCWYVDIGPYQRKPAHIFGERSRLPQGTDAALRSIAGSLILLSLSTPRMCSSSARFTRRCSSGKLR